MGVDHEDGPAAMGDFLGAAAAAEEAFTEAAGDPLHLLWSSDEGDSESDTESESSDDEKPKSTPLQFSQRSQVS